MNLTISPIRNTFSSKTNFKGNDDDYKVDYNTYLEDRERANYRGMNTGAFWGIIGTFGAMAVVAGMSESRQNKLDKEFFNDVCKVAQSDSVRQDTLLIKDMTDDENPDLILYKKDGSKIVVDLKNQQILQETKKLDVIK